MRAAWGQHSCAGELDGTTRPRVAAPAQWMSGERQSAQAGTSSSTSGCMLVELAASANLWIFFFSVLAFLDYPFRFFFFSVQASVSSVEPRNRTEEIKTELVGF
jgi:hypothetical protein